MNDQEKLDKLIEVMINKMSPKETHIFLYNAFRDQYEESPDSFKEDWEAHFDSELINESGLIYCKDCKNTVNFSEHCDCKESDDSKCYHCETPNGDCECYRCDECDTFFCVDCEHKHTCEFCDYCDRLTEFCGCSLCDHCSVISDDCDCMYCEHCKERYCDGCKENHEIWYCDNCNTANHEPSKGFNCWCINCDDCDHYYDSNEHDTCPECVNIVAKEIENYLENRGITKELFFQDYYDMKGMRYNAFNFINREDFFEYMSIADFINEVNENTITNIAEISEFVTQRNK